MELGDGDRIRQRPRVLRQGGEGDGRAFTATKAGELLIATYGGARGRELRRFDVRSIDAAVDHYERVDATRSDRHHGPRLSGTDHRRATAPRRRTVATPRQPVGSGTVLEAVPEGRVLVERAPPGRYDGRGPRAGAHKRWLLARAALRKSKAKSWAAARALPGTPRVLREAA